MQAVMTKERESILEVLNQTPGAFVGQWSGRKIRVGGAELSIARNNIRGGVNVWGREGAYSFHFDKGAHKWV